MHSVTFHFLVNESTWMSKNVPKLHQSHEITSFYINSCTYEDKQFKLAQTSRKTELLSENQAKIPNASRLKSLCVVPFFRRLLETFSMSKLGARQLVGNIIYSTFQRNQNFSVWSSLSLSKIKSPKTGQYEQNEAASRQSAVAVNFGRSQSTPN